MVSVQWAYIMVYYFPLLHRTKKLFQRNVILWFCTGINHVPSVTCLSCTFCLFSILEDQTHCVSLNTFASDEDYGLKE